MSISGLKRSVYLDLYTVVRSQLVSTACRRTVSTTSAINRGLRATREAAGENRAGHTFRIVHAGGRITGKGGRAPIELIEDGRAPAKAQQVQHTSELPALLSDEQAAEIKASASRVRELLISFCDSVSLDQAYTNHALSAYREHPAVDEIHKGLAAIGAFTLSKRDLDRRIRPFEIGLGGDDVGYLLRFRGIAADGTRTVRVRGRGRHEGMGIVFDANGLNELVMPGADSEQKVQDEPFQDASGQPEQAWETHQQTGSSPATEENKQSNATGESILRFRMLVQRARDMTAKSKLISNGLRERLVAAHRLLKKLDAFTKSGRRYRREVMQPLQTAVAEDAALLLSREQLNEGQGWRVCVQSEGGKDDFKLAFEPDGDIFINGTAMPPAAKQQAGTPQKEPDLDERLTHGSGFQANQERGDGNDDIPVAIPYTTAASEFLYGANVAIAALKAKRRKIYRLFHLRHRGEPYETIIRLAKEAGVPTDRKAGLALYDKISSGRPHNGILLEVSRIPAPPVLALQAPDPRTSIIGLNLARQAAEDVAIHGAPVAIPTLTRTWRYPFVVMLDGIKDPENVGSILRSAHFYGVDAVAIAANTCAPLGSAVLAKASSGACEAVRVLSLHSPAHFVADSARAGWKVYAAVAPVVPGITPADEVRKQISAREVAANSPLRKEPVVLMLGAEGEGLRANLIRQANRLISIGRGERSAEMPDVGVDSLNVGVAAGVLMEAFLRPPPGVEVADTGSRSRSGVRGRDLGF